MSTDRLRQFQQRPDLIPNDPGAWSIVSFVREAQGAQLLGRGGRRKATSAALLSDTVPQVAQPRPGLDDALGVAGAGAIRLISVSREGVRRLEFVENDTHLRGINSRVIRRFTVPDLVPGPHEYPQIDPAADLSRPAHPLDLAETVPGEVVAPGGAVSAAPIKDGRLFGLCILRTSDRAVLRFVAGAACAAWRADAQLLAFGGEWGVMLAEAAVE